MKLDYKKKSYNTEVDYYIEFDSNRYFPSLPSYPFVLFINKSLVVLNWYTGDDMYEDNDARLGRKIENFIKDSGFKFEGFTTGYQGNIYSIDCACLEEEEELFDIFFKQLSEIFKDE